jgi:hypothetical protein
MWSLSLWEEELMQKEVWSQFGDTLLRVEDAEPECGQDFCDSCGDCLSCYDGDWCPRGSHRWIEYAAI